MIKGEYLLQNYFQPTLWLWLLVLFITQLLNFKAHHRIDTEGVKKRILCSSNLHSLSKDII